MSETDDEAGFRPRALGEIAIRVQDMARARRFYEHVLRLPLLADRSAGGREIVFYALGPSHGGHTAVVALFRDAITPEPAASTLHHVALAVSVADQEAAKRWFTRCGLAWREEVFGWIGWRGLFVEDPDGNTVELVAADPAFRDRPTPSRDI